MRNARELSPISQEVFDLFTLLDEFGRIKRAVKMADGTYESNSDHSFDLALIGYEYVKRHAPELDAQKVLLYGLVHDLAELITGDTPTLTLTKEELAKKKLADDKALEQMQELLKKWPHILRALNDYESLNDVESQTTYWLDKCLTIPTHFFDTGENLRSFGIERQSEIAAWRERTLHKMNTHAPDAHATVKKLFEEMYQKMHDELCEPD